MATYKDIIEKYFNRNKGDIFSNNVIHEMNGVVLQKTNNAIFDFFGVMIDDVNTYCQSCGFTPDKIVFVSSYDIEVQNCTNMRVKMVSDSKISVIEENGKKIVRVCICEFVSMEGTDSYEK